MLEEKEQMDKKTEEETLQRRIKKLEEIVENIKNISEEEKKLSYEINKFLPEFLSSIHKETGAKIQKRSQLVRYCT